MKTRPDTDITVTFERRGGQWSQFHVHFQEVLDDQTFAPHTIGRTESYMIEDLPAQVKTDLAAAWAGMKAHRDAMTPIT